MRILFAWELGANLGHVNKITQVAQHLSDDFDVTIAARNVVAVRTIAPDLNAQILGAPYVPTRPSYAGEPPSQSYPGALLQEGWDRADHLIALTEAWRNLFDIVDPDVIVVQAAPTALLAARGSGVPTAILGSGYDAPPCAHPMPCFAPNDAAAVSLALEQETIALNAANLALAAAGQPAMDTFCDLLDVDVTLLVSYPETDHFAPREKVESAPATYLGQLLSIATGQEVSWRNRGTAQILAYLRPGTLQFNAGIQGLAVLAPDSDIILAAPGIDPSQAEALSARGMLVVDGTVRLDRLLPDCDLGISHGTNGIGAAFVAFGVPQLMMPTHREQMLFARSVANEGLGLGIAGRFEGPQVVEAIQKALASEGLRAKAKRTATELVSRNLINPGPRAADLIRALAVEHATART